MKITTLIENLTHALNKFAENHTKYNLPKFDISIKIFPDLSYQIELDFIKFPCEISKGNFVMMESIHITPDKSLEIENWVWLYYNERYKYSNDDFSIIVKQPFVRWVLENRELFESNKESPNGNITRTNSSSL